MREKKSRQWKKRKNKTDMVRLRNEQKKEQGDSGGHSSIVGAGYLQYSTLLLHPQKHINIRATKSDHSSAFCNTYGELKIRGAYEDEKKERMSPKI